MALPFEEQFADVLHNIESAIVRLFRDDPALVDYEVDGGLGALIAHYAAERQEKPTPPPPTDEKRRLVFDAVREMCEWRMGRQDLSAEIGAPAVEVSMDDVVACLKRVRKSAQRWTKRAGRQGYLTFVDKFIP